MDLRYIRNFSVIAHIDHGKSTLADRFLEITGALQAREMEAQVLDAMDLERERGITIKAHPVRLSYRSNAGRMLQILIDTPGHVDFSYEVDEVAGRGGEGASALDASQGVEAERSPMPTLWWTTASVSSGRSRDRSAGAKPLGDPPPN